MIMNRRDSRNNMIFNDWWQARQLAAPVFCVLLSDSSMVSTRGCAHYTHDIHQMYINERLSQCVAC